MPELVPHSHHARSQHRKLHHSLPLALSIIGIAALGGLPGCTDPGADPATGTLSLNLLGQASSGAVYRLRDATIVVTGPTSTKYWYTEDAPDRTTLTANVAAGAYTSLLQPGWRIERVEGQSTFNVPAQLVTLNPVAFEVLELQRTNVPLRFRVFGEEIDMSQGYDIVLDVEECVAQELTCGDSKDNDCDGAVDCADPDCSADITCAVCGNGTLDTGEQCDDGNTASLDGCSSTCTLEPLEIEPNEDGSPQPGGSGIFGNDFATAAADGNGPFGGPFTLVASLVPAGDEDVLAFENPAAGPYASLRVDLWSSPLGIGVPCGTAIDTGLVLRDATGAVLASNDDRSGSADRCSGLSRIVAPGERVYIHVTDFGDNTVIPNYVITASLGGTCGSGSLEPGEQCDDGNAADGDGCSAQCTLEPLAETEPNDTVALAAGSPLEITGDIALQGAIAAPGDLDLYRVSIGAPTVVRFDTLSAFFNCTGTTTTVRLFDAAGALVAQQASGGLSPCGSLTYFLTPGVYFVQVEETGNNAALASYFLLADFQTDLGLEPEAHGTSGANDLVTTASTTLAGSLQAFVLGDHQLETDVDFYAITVPPGARIRAEIIEGDAERCESGGVDSHLALFDPTGTLIVGDDDDGRGFCSMIDGIGSTPRDPAARNPGTTPQTYYLRVQSSTIGTGLQRLFTYRLQVSIRP